MVSPISHTLMEEKGEGSLPGIGLGGGGGGSLTCVFRPRGKFEGEKGEGGPPRAATCDEALLGRMKQKSVIYGINEV